MCSFGEESFYDGKQILGYEPGDPGDLDGEHLEGGKRTDRKVAARV